MRITSRLIYGRFMAVIDFYCVWGCWNSRMLKVRFSSEIRTMEIRDFHMKGWAQFRISRFVVVPITQS